MFILCKVGHFDFEQAATFRSPNNLAVAFCKESNATVLSNIEIHLSHIVIFNSSNKLDSSTVIWAGWSGHNACCHGINDSFANVIACGRDCEAGKNQG